MNAFKTFTKMDEAIKEMCTISSSIDNLFKDEETVNITEKEVTKILLKIIANDIPSIRNEDYLNCKAISVSAAEVGFKCSRNVSFGWRNEINAEGENKFNMRISINSPSEIARNTETFKSAKEKGWKLHESVVEKKKSY